MKDCFKAFGRHTFVPGSAILTLIYVKFPSPSQTGQKFLGSLNSFCREHLHDTNVLERMEILPHLYFMHRQRILRT